MEAVYFPSPHLCALVTQSQAAPDGLGYLVLQLLDPHLEEDAYPGDSGPVMLQVYGPDVLTELLDERHNFIAVELRADYLGPEPDRIPGFLPPLPCPRRIKFSKASSVYPASLTPHRGLSLCLHLIQVLPVFTALSCRHSLALLCSYTNSHLHQESCFCPRGRNDFTTHAFEA